jgi:hypothetical protein
LLANNDASQDIVFLLKLLPLGLLVVVFVLAWASALAYIELFLQPAHLLLVSGALRFSLQRAACSLN